MFIFCFASSQNKIIKPRLSFTTDSIFANSIVNKVILEGKVLYGKEREPYNFNNPVFKNLKLLKVYKNLVFQNKKERELRQWNSSIIIYFDKKIPKNVIENFITFYSQLSQVKNLKISFTKKIEKANYYIKSTNEVINSYSEDYEFKSEDERKTSILTGGTYNINTDENNILYSGVLTVNMINKKNSVLLKQIKQLFFMSLGSFCISNRLDKNSLLSKKYEKVDYISKKDISLLKIHYHNIYDQRIDRVIFNKLIQNSN